MEPMKSGDLTLREYQDSDFDAVAKLYKTPAVMKYAGGSVTRRNLRLIIDRRPKTDYFLVKEINGEFAGTSLLEVDRRDPTACWLTAVNTQQGAGISTKALPLMVGLAKSLGMRMVRARVAGRNQVVQSLLESGGFVARRTRRGPFQVRAWIIYERVID